LNSLPQEKIWLWIFVVLFLALGLGYSTLTPIFENSDETLHYPYIKHLADGNGLPVAAPGQLWNQEATQPPLYYAIVAASTFWIDTTNLPDYLQYNPHWLFTEVRAVINDNQNRVLHGPMDAFPYRQTALAIQIGRWWSLLFGVITVICSFYIFRQLYPKSLALTVTATALTALTPQFIRVSATVSNDSLSAALAAAAVLLALKFTQPAHMALAKGRRTALNFNHNHALLLGLLAGLALLTKLSSLTTFFLVAFILFWRLLFLGELHQRPWLKLAGWLLLAAAVTVLLNGWYLWRNYQLYGEWLATETHLNLAGRGYLSLPQIWALRDEIQRAYWATFGWGQIRPPEWVFAALRIFTTVGLASLLVAIVTRLAQGNKNRPLPLNLAHINLEHIIFLAFWAALNLALYLRWIMAVGSVSHTRLIFPAITAISLLLALGWHALAPPRREWWISAVVAVALLALNLYSLGWLIYPAFTPNQPTSPAAGPPLDITFLNSLKLTSGNVTASTAGSDAIQIQADWQVLTPPAKNYSVAAVLLAPNGAALAQRQTYPGLGLRPTRYLQPGQTFTDIYPLKLATVITQPLVARAVISLFDFNSPDRAGLPATDSQGNPVTPVVGQLKLTPQPWPQYHPTTPAEVNFNHAIKLVGVDLSPTVTFYWQSVAPVSEDYVVFIHLLDAAGNVVAQADAPPTNNAYPTRWWLPGETIADARALPSAPGATRLRLGLYSLSTGQRLPVLASSLPVEDNGVTINLPQ